MSALRWLAVGAVGVLLAGGARAEEKDLAKMLVGKWEFTKSHEGGPPVGAIVVFTKDGKFKVTAKKDDTTKEMEGTYKVEGNKFVVTFKAGDKDVSHTITVKKITDKEMTAENDEGKVSECKKKS